MMRKKILTLAIFVGAMLLLTATGVLAASPVASNPHPTLQDPIPAPTIRATVTVTNPVAVAIARFFSNGVFTTTYTDTVQSVLGLHDGGMGYGEIARCFFLAQLSGQDLDYITDLRETGLGWGEVARNVSLAPGNRGRNLGAIRSGRPIPADDLGVEVESASTKGPPHEPKGWEHGKGQGSQGQGKGKGPKH